MLILDPRSVGDPAPARRSRPRPASRAAWIAVVAGLLLPVALPVPPAEAASPTFYVATTGSDSNPGTLSRPWRTVSRGLRAMDPGETLVVRGGIYLERVNESLEPARSNAPVRVRAYPGERPVIKGLLWVHDTSYWTFDGINVTWDPNTGYHKEHMVRIVDGVGWTFKNSEVWGARSFAGILVAGTTSGQPSNWRLTHNCIHDTYPSNDTSQDHNVYVNTGMSAGPGLIERNIMFNAVNGTNIKLGGPSSSSGGAANVTVRYNTLYNARQNVMVSWASSSNSIYRNIIGKLASDNLAYGTIRGYELFGRGNTAAANVAFAANRVIYNDDLSDPGVGDPGSNRFPLDPMFDSTAGCGGFHPGRAEAKGYGRWAQLAAVAPTAAFVVPTEVIGQFPTRVSWGASTPDLPPAGYELQRSVDGAAFSRIALSSDTVPRAVTGTAVGHNYRFRVRAVDTRGRWSAWAAGPTFTVARFQESSSAVRYGGEWQRGTSDGYSGGAVRYSSAGGATATFTTKGRAIAWLTTKGPTRGRAEIYIGDRRVTTVDLYASALQPLTAAFTMSWPTSVTRTITIRVLGTAGRSRVDVDAFYSFR